MFLVRNHRNIFSFLQKDRFTSWGMMGVGGFGVTGGSEPFVIVVLDYYEDIC